MGFCPPLVAPNLGARLHFAGKILFAAVVPASGLALGSIKPALLAVLAVLAAISTALLWVEPIDRLSRNARFALAGLALLTLATALQAVPLPAAVVRLIAPVNADLWAGVFGPLQEPGPSWHPLSIDPVGTQVQLARSFFYLCLFCGAVRLATLPEGVAFLELLIVAATVAMAFAALAHPALGAERVFGIYRPRDAYAYQVGYYAPLLNVNHLTAYLNVGVCVALARTLRNPGRKWNVVLIASALLLAGTSVWAGSRGGMGGLALGVVLTLLLHRLTRSERPESSTITLASLIALGAVVLIAMGGSETARGELTNTQMGKLAVAREGLRLVSLSPIFGVGRGGFESLFPLVEQSTSYQTTTHPENIVVQWVTEWGAPVSLVAVVLFAWAMRPFDMLRRVTPAAGAWAAVVATVVHDLVDFHLEVPGVTALAIVCMASVVAGRRRPSREASSPSKLRGGVWCLAGVTAVAAAAAARFEGQTVSDERATFTRLAADATLSRDGFRQELRGAVQRHPAEAYLPLMGAVRAQTVDGERAMPWIANALERNPRLGGAHFALARVLAPRNPAQGRLEYRLAWSYDAGLRDAVMREAVRWVDSASDAFELVTDGEDGPVALERIVDLVSKRLPATASILDTEILRREPQARGPILRRAQALVADFTNEEPWCTSPDCERAALQAAEAAVAALPNECASLLTLARAQARLGNPKAGDTLTQATDEVTTRRLLCKEEAAVFADSVGFQVQTATLLDQIARYSCESDAESAARYTWLGRFEEDRGRDARALTLYKRAVELDPQREDIYDRIFELAQKNRLHSDAIVASEAMLRRHPADATWTARRGKAIEDARAIRVLPLTGVEPLKSPLQKRLP